MCTVIRENGFVCSAASDWALDLATYPMSMMIAAGGISAALFGKWTMKVFFLPIFCYLFSFNSEKNEFWKLMSDDSVLFIFKHVTGSKWACFIFKICKWKCSPKTAIVGFWKFYASIHSNHIDLKDIRDMCVHFLKIYNMFELETTLENTIPLCVATTLYQGRSKTSHGYRRIDVRSWILFIRSRSYEPQSTCTLRRFFLLFISVFVLLREN